MCVCVMAERNAHAYKYKVTSVDSYTPRGFHLALIEPSDSLKSPFHRGQPRKMSGWCEQSALLFIKHLRRAVPPQHQNYI